ncbi:DUF647-domain-containing protein, partial [Saccharata proteae CBS 121410]
VLDVFLPAGYPQSVTDDYLEYQIYDSLQAFSSSIAGLLSSRAVLEGFGVGDSSASATGALLLSILQESMGRLATILFAYRLGSALEPECKMYRLAADVFNDTAMVLDCLSPAFPKAARVLLLSFSSVLRALCGVAAGSSKAALSAHFARQQNLGELNAKDSSQETVISLMGMLVGSVVVSWISSPLATWVSMLLLLTVHLATNHAAVRAVSMRSLNRQRATIALSNLIQHDEALTPQEVSKRERIFERGGALRWTDGRVIGRCRIGVRLDEVVGRLGVRDERTQSVRTNATALSGLLRVFQHESYVLWFDASAREAAIVLKQDSSPVSQLKGWTTALLLLLGASERQASHGSQQPLGAGDGDVEVESMLREALKRTNEVFDGFATRLAEAGFDLQVAALETRPGSTRAAAQ